LNDSYDVDKVISVCCAKDLPVWTIAAKKLLECVDARNYVVIVPESDEIDFRKKTPQAIEVINERRYTGYIERILKPNFNRRNCGRYGWYLQQLIKLSALEESREADVYLIWDADTVPLKKLRFRNDGSLNYYKAAEHHFPYFDAIKRLLGLNKIVPHSFISQCFPIKGIWMKEFVHFVESRHDIPWIEAIISTTDFRIGSGFSEYETLGTFCFSHFPAEMSFLDSNWTRSGNSLIGSAERIYDPLVQPLLNRFDYAAFEVWDCPSRRERRRMSILERLRRLVEYKRNDF
jgi:hypothetical protein